MAGTPFGYDKPERRAERAAAHVCQATGSTVYCSLLDCPYCDGGEKV